MSGTRAPQSSRPSLRKSATPTGSGEKAGEVTQLELRGQAIEARLRVHPRARRLSIRVKATTGELVVVRPARTSRAEALEFVHSHTDWILSRLGALPRPVPFAEGESIPLRGELHLIRSVAAQLRAVEANEETRTLNVAGTGARLAARLKTWLKNQARADIARAGARYAAASGQALPRITLRDTTSRWGSCSERSGLSFSWRLVMAPPFVLDYVVAHECAHLVHMNHGPEFWEHLRTLTGEVDAAEAWLDRHGARLHAYGRTQPDEAPV